MEKKINNKINLLLVVCNNVMNGSERYAVDIAKNLPKEIFNIKFATPSKGSLSEILKKSNIDELIYHNSKIGKYTLKGLLNLRKIIKSNDISIVHSNAKFFPCFIGKLSGVKLNIETIHGIFFSDEQLKVLPFWRKVYGFIAKHFVDIYIAISQNDSERLKEKFHIANKKIKIIYNGLDKSNLNLDKEINEKKITDEILIGTIGRLTFQKAQSILIEAFALLIKENKYSNIRLKLIGDGECKEEINSLTKSLKLNAYVEIIPYSQNIFEHLKKFDIFILTSRFEGVPYVLLESMYLGVPIVTTDVGGINNVLTNNYDAILTKPEDPVSTKNALQLLINDEKLRKRLSENAKQTINKYSVDDMIRQLTKLYTNSVP